MQKRKIRPGTAPPETQQTQPIVMSALEDSPFGTLIKNLHVDGQLLELEARGPERSSTISVRLTEHEWDLMKHFATDPKSKLFSKMLSSHLTLLETLAEYDAPSAYRLRELLLSGEVLPVLCSAKLVPHVQALLLALPLVDNSERFIKAITASMVKEEHS